MKKILILGSSGMLGHMVYLYLKENHFYVYGADIQKTIFTDSVLDISNINELNSLSNNITFDYVINCCAILGKSLSSNPALSENINVTIPQSLPKIFKKAKIIHISSDYVFSGKKLTPYTINDRKTNTTPYGLQKRNAESKNARVINLRLSIIGPTLELRDTLFNLPFINKSINGFTNVKTSLCTTLEIAQKIERIISFNIDERILHISSKRSFSKFLLLKEIVQVFNLPTAVNKVKDNNDRDYTLKNSFKFLECPAIETQLLNLKKYMIKHSKIYRIYLKNTQK